jgi:hypothetical protein
MLVGFFREFADAEEAVGDANEAKRLRELASRISASMNQLYAPTVGCQRTLLLQF